MNKSVLVFGTILVLASNIYGVSGVSIYRSFKEGIEYQFKYCVLAAAVLVFLWIVGAYAEHRKRQRKIRELERKLDGESETREEECR